MERSDGLAWAGVIVASLAGINFAIRFADHPYFYEKSVGALSIFAVGWGLATYGPVLIAAHFWKLAERSRAPWLFHILLLPTVYGLLLGGNAVMLSVLNVSDFDDTLGAPIMPALLAMIVTVTVYYSALAVSQLARFGDS